MRPTGFVGVEEILASTPTGSWRAVQSWAEFIALPTTTETSPGVWFFDEAVWSSGEITVPVGSRVEGGVNSLVYAAAWDTTRWVFDVDAPGFSGPLRLWTITIHQNNTGSSASCVSVTGSFTRLALISRCILSGGSAAIVDDGYPGVCDIDLCAMSQSDRGIVVRGSIGIMIEQNNGILNMNTGAIGIEVESSTVLGASSSIVLNAVNMSLDSTQYVVAIADALTATDPAVIQVIGGGSGGPQGRFFRRDGGDMSPNDVRLVVTGNAVEPGWKVIGVAARRDQADPLVVIVNAAGVDSLIPFSDVAENLLITASTEIRVSLVKNAGLTDWYFEYAGPLNGITMTLSTKGLGKRASSAGPNASFLKWQKNAAPGYAGFVDVPASEVDWSSSNAYVPFSGTAISPMTNKGDRFRPVLVNGTDTENQHLGSLSLGLESSL